MKRALAVIALVIAGLSCLVDRRSGDFECDIDSDCDGLAGERECVNNFCAMLSCPAVCDNGCDTGRICKVNCSSPTECKNGINCPTGYTCEFTCSQDCKPSCPLGCTVSCTGMNASCGPITCGAGATCTCMGIGTCL